MKPAKPQSAPSPLLRTRFYRPSLPSDLVDRPRLTDQLNCSSDRPLTLVTAPAGYGKSVLVSAWLSTCERPSAWLSLDETVDDLGVFLAHFVAAIQAIFPGALRQTQTLLTAISLPPLGVLAGSLINELDEVEHDFVMVLDDYHTIHQREIHDLLTMLLRPPAQRMRLVLITRKDPPLPKSALLAGNQMTEVRHADLRFSTGETAAFMQNALGSPLSDEAVAVLAEKTEGWIASLRLAALALRYSSDAASRVADLQALERDRNLTDYLMSEVLARTPPAVADFLLQTAILDRMCGPLCEALIGRADPEMDAQARLEWLEQNNLFTVSLDNERRWYRYHHLFRSFLQSRLEQGYAAGEVARLHARASAWYAGQGLLEEALQHALRGHEVPTAVRLMAEHRHALMDAEEWQFHERMLRMFPAETVAAHPDLTLMAAWVARYGRFFDLAHVLELLDRAASLVAQMPDQGEHALHLQGEIDTLRITVIIEAAGDPETVIGLGQQALATTPRAWYCVRAIAWLWLAVAYQMAGRLDQAYAALAEGQAEDRGGAGTGGVLTRFRRVDGGEFAGDTAVGQPFSCCQRDPSPERIAGLGAPFAQQRCLPAQRSAGRPDARKGAGRAALSLHTDGLFAERVHLRVDLPGARSAGRGASRSWTWQSISCVRPGTRDSCSWRKRSRRSWPRGKAISTRPATGRRRSARICRSH